MSRSTQPYRKGPREQGGALSAMLRGRGALPNPQDIPRMATKVASGPLPQSELLRLLAERRTRR